MSEPLSGACTGLKGFDSGGFWDRALNSMEESNKRRLP
jgi:hypothetical protein